DRERGLHGLPHVSWRHGDRSAHVKFCSPFAISRKESRMNNSGEATAVREPGHDERIRWEQLASRERTRLVRLCAHLSGSTDAAEDLAQDTLIEARKHREKLHDWSGDRQWL